MGIIYTRPPETAPVSAPIFRTPFTDITAAIGHHDGDAKCLPFQLRWIDCGEAYGRELAYEKCKYLYQDFIECAKQWKQRARMGDMMEKRYQLWFSGLRGVGPPRPLFHETPRYDGYMPNFIMDDCHWK